MARLDYPWNMPDFKFGRNLLINTMMLLLIVGFYIIMTLVVIIVMIVKWIIKRRKLKSKLSSTPSLNPSARSLTKEERTFIKESRFINKDDIKITGNVSINKEDVVSVEKLKLMQG